ncbi:mismatch-specific DNA-glycosylase [Roseomonas fluvialis]|uniref:Mismatch-specific DNA-glycosylase n=1 Tax=Roseomonas fluvialis TaxID=1750527 RepID=A0ABM7XZD0_9PROT|nr:mismatch-specific DNA-glycosylase [Roseomonas fluvialis]BDG70861.1 mismatch-specific DNA-glycosylase [Roseomonas fluvialis]
MPAAILPDLLRPGLRLVFCGTAAGAASAARGAYYAGRGNRFWPILAAAGLTPRRLAPEEFAVLDRWGIGLTDIAKHVSGNDADLPRGALDATDLRRRLRVAKPAMIAFNGKAAAAAALGRPSRGIAFGPQASAPELPPAWVLPSTSGAAGGSWDAAHWMALGRWFHEGET